jgi:branched-chain amino acid transport system permease protein
VTEFLQNVIDAISLGSLYALVALGVALIFGIMQLINFAHGELIMVAAYAVILLAGAPLPVVLFGGLATAVVAALLMERVAFRPVRGANPATLLVTSFAISFLLQSLAMVVFGSLPRTTNLSPFVTESVEIGGLSVSKLNVITVAVTAALLVALGLFLGRTSLGVQMRAAAEDFRMARLLGVRANVVIATAFAISGLLAGVASLLLVAQSGTVSPQMGLYPVLVAFIATVLGGMGSLVGAVIGGYVLGSLTVSLQVLLPLEFRSYRDAIAYAIVIVVLVVRPQGLVVARSTQARV